MNNKEIEMLVSAGKLFEEITETQDHPEFNITLINILSPQQFGDCHIKDSVNIEANVIANYVEDWDRTRSLIIYGAGDDVTICILVYKKLLDLGFEDVRILIGGMQGWLNDEYPCQGVCKMDYLKA